MQDDSGLFWSQIALKIFVIRVPPNVTILVFLPLFVEHFPFLLFSVICEVIIIHCITVAAAIR